jgi:serine/threonine-protein kinase ULK/ATG1
MAGTLRLRLLVKIIIIERNKVQGKFLELLETEIKVLKQCNNQNIIKLYDLKKTSNNFYLILEYCNEGLLFMIRRF